MVRPVYTKVEKRMMGRQEMWRLSGHCVDENGEPLMQDGQVVGVLYDFPVDTMEWRAVEYDLDPEADKDTLLDMVMAEAFMTEADYLENEPALYDCDDVETARKHHIARCSRSKLRQRLSTRKADNILRKVRDESPFHPEIMKMKRDVVKETRAEHMARKSAARRMTATKQDSEAARLAMWKQHQQGRGANPNG